MKKKTLLKSILPAVIVLTLVFGVLADVKAAPYYQGKMINFIVPYSPGGGTDIWARLVSTYFGKFIPGKPGIVVRNISGGGGVIGGNKAWLAKPDGKTCLITGGGVVANNIVRPRGILYKLQEMHPIISLPTGNVYYVKPGIIKEPKDIVKAKGLRWGHTPVTAGTAGGFAWSKELLGFECDRIIQGYGGGGPARLAFIAGETNFTGADTAGFNTAVKPLVKEGEAVPVFQQGILDNDGNVVREAAVSDIPTALELYEQIYGKKPSGKVWEAYKLMAGTRTFTKTVLVPPKTPEKVVEILRKAAIELANDPKFQKEIAKIVPGASHWVGETLVRLYPSAVSGPPELLSFMRKVLEEKYEVSFK